MMMKMITLLIIRKIKMINIDFIYALFLSNVKIILF